MPYTYAQCQAFGEMESSGNGTPPADWKAKCKGVKKPAGYKPSGKKTISKPTAKKKTARKSTKKRTK